MPQIYESVTDFIGKTPLGRLSRLTADLGADVVVKLESFNPGGSIKDRIGFSMIQDGEGTLAQFCLKISDHKSGPG